MKKLMVVRCEAKRRVDKGLAAVCAGIPIPPWPTLDEFAYSIRCENPLGHAESRHRGSVDDDGHRVWEWGPFA